MKFTLLFFLFTIAVNAQNIKGTVLNKETNKPIENVSITIKGESTGTYTNSKGQFALHYSSKIKSTTKLIFSSIGYNKKEVFAEVLKQNNYVVFLLPKVENLKEIIVSSNKKLKRNIGYKKLAEMPFGVSNFGSTIINDKLYVTAGDLSFIEENEKRAIDNSETMSKLVSNLKLNGSWEGYSNKIQIYDFKNNSWEVTKEKLDKKAFHKTVAVNNKLYIFGGKTISPNKKREYLNNKIEILNTTTNEIVIDDAYPHQAINFTAVTYQENIIIMGGSTKLLDNGKKLYRNNSYIFNTTTGYWHQLTNMLKDKEANGIAANNKVFLIGGFRNGPLKNIESYDLETAKWELEGTLFNGIEKPALAYNNNIIYIFNSKKILTYNTKTNLLKEYKIDIPLKYANMHYLNGKLYILGGSNSFNYKIKTSKEVYSIDLQEFKTTKVAKEKYIS
ncbi:MULTISPECIES: Kelch repeat-containing protein [unclassified Cellulophaga]|uniref:Kelch repeat-containing protein n=1 Tax=unclassified Cellulophaga TaxID=2634405 RepID=UPI0026E23D75|nr:MULTISPECIES: carboxypeptidase-like regulatory domain-containing protein [unclassified Cellulophaga]MDO6490094.1 carboxypeptidase-like regulatory domain-containing protein [Cellulophaga sp. 2_MG-2023]MDO6494712.1 carboxypeptidase-like regulatory domain-containing protein [Cellulophaga sp. 3_MG-2023]